MVHADPAMTLKVSVVLGIHDQAKLDQLLADQQNPSSPNIITGLHQHSSPGVSDRPRRRLALWRNG